MKKLILFILLFLVILSSVSAITMRRTHTFVQNEEMIYDFLGQQYAITVKQIVGGTGRVIFEVNGYEERVDLSVPAAFQDMKVSIGEIGAFEVELKFLWDREDTDPDATLQIAENYKKVVTARGKRFSILVKNFDDIKMLATIDINGQEVTVGELDKVTLKDGSTLRSGEIKGYNSKIIDLMIWASDEPWDYDQGEAFDFEEKFTENEQKIVQIKGLRLNIKIDEIDDDGYVHLRIGDESLMLKETEREILDSGIEVKVDHASLKIPPTVQLSLNVPDDLGQEETSITIERIVGKNQRDEFEAEGITIVTRFVSLDKDEDKVVVDVNGKNSTLRVGDQGRSGNVQYSLKILNENAYPPKIILSFTIPKKTLPKPPEPEEEIEEIEEEIEEVEEEIEEQEELEEIEEDISDQEIPEPELPEDKPPEGEVLTLKESTEFVINKIINFFKNLF